MAKDDKTDVDPNWAPPGAEGAPAPKIEEPTQEDPIEALKRQLAEEKQARVAAEQQANTAAQQAHKAKEEVADNQLQLVTTAINRVKEQSAALKSAYSAAMSAGDFDAAANIHEELSDTRAKLLQLENGKAAMEAQPKPQAPEPIRAADPVEAFAAQLTPQSAAWVRAHPEYVTDAELNNLMVAAHNSAVKNGIRPDTPQYFSHVEGRLGVYKGQPAHTDDDTMSAASRPAVRDTAPPAAPPSRGDGGRRIARLSAEEMEIAELSGMTPEQYAANREALKKEGRYH